MSTMRLQTNLTPSQAAMPGMPQPASRCLTRRCPTLQRMTRSINRLQCRQSLCRTVQAAATDSGTVKMVVQGRQIELTPSIKQYAQEKVTNYRLVSHQQELDFVAKLSEQTSPKIWIWLTCSSQPDCFSGWQGSVSL